ncbi:hypothetical protein COLO4_27468 [Corchorus olitorius]|uniref:Uncharacterized protein n=1 Tax=Corchorus olitorius TaxID=93759 RepID=A0A1R3HQT7_9ROSI|nr:hypothetical protein COLO4_27468 [Corchorus olitorius]
MSEPINQATASASGEVVEANASGAFVAHGSGSQAPSTSAFFNVSASGRSSSSQDPATASVTVSCPTAPQAPASYTGPAPTHTAATQTAAKKSKATKQSSQRPLPKILRMPPPSGRCWQDEAGNFHGLKRGRSSPASVAKFKKTEVAREPALSDLSCRTTSEPQGPVRRSPRNFKKNPTVGSSIEVNQSSSCVPKRKAADVVTTQGSQTTANSKPVKGKKKLFE